MSRKFHIIDLSLFCFSLIDLALLFELVSRVPDATVKMQKIVVDHICQMGIEAIERVSRSAFDVN